MYNGNLTYRSVGRTHRGKVRRLNEDAFLERVDIGLFAVADGMGGHQRGDVASARIVDGLEAIAVPSDGRAFLAAVKTTLQQANEELYQQGAAISDDQTMGATVVTMIVIEDHFACLWAGDSRLYRFRGGRAELMTKDHSFVQELVDTGDLSEEDAEDHPMRNVITRAIGAHGGTELDTCHGAVEPGDVFLLATDGVTNVCSSEELAQLIAGNDLAEAADQIVLLCLERGAPDNLSLVIVESASA
ncbi:MAG: PP2C family protein-serine/threonine phosphatase [Alphaproteobacteria bacterium]